MSPKAKILLVFVTAVFVFLLSGFFVYLSLDRYNQTSNSLPANQEVETIVLLFTISSFSFILLIALGSFSIWQGLQSSNRQLEGKVKSKTTELLDVRTKDQAIMSSIADGVIAINKEGKVVLINHAATMLIGYFTIDVLGKPYKDFLKFFAEVTGVPQDDFILKAMAGQKAETDEHLVILNKNGSKIPVEQSSAPIFDSVGNVWGVVLVLREVAKQRQMEKMKDEFVSLASHELRTPMTAIKGYLSMIREGDYGQLESNLLEPLSYIEVSTERLIHLVNDMLNIARIESGRLKIELVNGDVGAVIKEVVGGLTPLAKQRNLYLKATVGKTDHVQMDTIKVNEVLNNLIGNALKFTEHGGVEIITKDYGSMIKVYVKDTGVGIPKEDQRKLFGKFEQISNQVAGKPVGTGLGLYLSRELMEKMGGEVTLEESQPGVGSAFSFTLPKAGTLTAKKVAAEIAREAMEHPDQK